jgi:ATP-dependent RNA helicase DDX60
VVFFGVPLDKIQRLMLSRLPPLTGQFPLSTTLSLRLFNVLDGSDNAPAARDAVRGIFGLARLSVSSKTGEAEMRHHFRFSVDYLRRSKLLDEAGKTLLLTNLVAPLHENEPGNLALVALLRAGYFHKLSANLDSNRQQTTRKFVLVLSHLFSRRYMRRISSTEAKALIGNAASVVVLPPLPQEAERVLESHNQRILKIFSNYTVAYAKRSSTVLDIDRSLPLSGELPKPVTASQDIPMVQLLRRHTLPVISRSAFVANSGHGDNFPSIEDLDRTTRPGLHLNKSVIPYLQLASESAPFSLNALLYDFFVHGSVSASCVAVLGEIHLSMRTGRYVGDDKWNRLVLRQEIFVLFFILSSYSGRGEVWYILDDFFLVLVQLQTSIEQLFRQAIKDANTDTEGGDTFEPPSLDDDLEDRREYFASKEGVQGVSEAFAQRPPSIPEGDWDVYRVVAAVRGDFETKFKAMWA